MRVKPLGMSMREKFASQDGLFLDLPSNFEAGSDQKIT